MIILNRCGKYFADEDQFKIILHNATCLINPHDHLVILAPSESGKSTIVRMLCGLEHPDAGTITRDDSFIWPLGYNRIFQPGLTGEENVRAAAGLLGLDADTISVFCQQFSELGNSYYQPLGKLTPSNRAKLSFAFSFALPVTTYISDEMVGVGSMEFRKKCMVALEMRMQKSGLILFTTNLRIAKRLGKKFAVLINGQLTFCPDAEHAAKLYATIRTQQDDMNDLVGALKLA